MRRKSVMQLREYKIKAKLKKSLLIDFTYLINLFSIYNLLDNILDICFEDNMGIVTVS